MANKGWIKLHRSLQDKAFVNNPEKLALWIHLLMLANHTEREQMFAGEPIKCNPGQFTTGRKQLAEMTGISESKIYRILKYFEEKEQQIEQQTCNKNSLITIKNWGFYQFEEDDEQQVDNNWTTSEQQVNTPKELKNKKKKRTLSGADAPRENSSPEFNSIENMRTEQRIDSLTRWNKVLSIWKSTEADYILKASCEKYWMTYSKEFQEEMVQFLEGLGAKSIHLSGLWISAMMKNKFFHPGQIQIEIEKKAKPVTNNIPRHLKNDNNNF
jgi:hypothetical protein